MKRERTRYDSCCHPDCGQPTVNGVLCAEHLKVVLDKLKDGMDLQVVCGETRRITWRGSLEGEGS